MTEVFQCDFCGENQLRFFYEVQYNNKMIITCPACLREDVKKPNKKGNKKPMKEKAKRTPATVNKLGERPAYEIPIENYNGTVTPEQKRMMMESPPNMTSRAKVPPHPGCDCFECVDKRKEYALNDDEMDELTCDDCHEKYYGVSFEFRYPNGTKDVICFSCNKKRRENAIDDTEMDEVDEIDSKNSFHDEMNKKINKAILESTIAMEPQPTKIKMFARIEFDNLEKDINKFIKANGVELVDVKFKTTSESMKKDEYIKQYYAIIFYKGELND